MEILAKHLVLRLKNFCI